MLYCGARACVFAAVSSTARARLPMWRYLSGELLYTVPYCIVRSISNVTDVTDTGPFASCGSHNLPRELSKRLLAPQ